MAIHLELNSSYISHCQTLVTAYAMSRSRALSSGLIRSHLWLESNARPHNTRPHLAVVHSSISEPKTYFISFA